MENKILLVDDDPINNYLNQLLIRKATGIEEIETVNTCEKALSYIDQYYEKQHAFPRYIFVDLKLEGMDGFEFIENLLSKYEVLDNVSLVILTNSSNPKDQEKADDFGILHYIQKPLNKEKIQAIFLSPSYSFKYI